MTDMTTQDALLAAYKQAEAELYSILNHFDRRGLLPDNVTPQDVQEAVALLFERLDKQDRILAALREPSEGVVEAALNEYDRRYSHGPLSMRLTRHEPYHRASLTESLSAAVAAAEQEVGRE